MKVANKLAGLALSICFGLLIGGDLAKPVSAAQFHGDQAYQINAGDVLHIFVWNEEELTREVLVQPDGKFSFPMVGEVSAGGKTTLEIADSVVTGLEEFIRDKPVVTVSVLGINGHKIFVIGKVARPGEFVINSNVDVMQALALAGGLNSYAAEDEIQILRRDQTGKQKAIPFEYQQVKEGNDLHSNILLQSGDVVVVP